MASTPYHRGNLPHCCFRFELETLLEMPVDVACEDLLKDGVSESARTQAIAL